MYKWFTDPDMGPTVAIVLAFIVIGSICFHEVCHVVAAHYQGDDTAIEQGYLTFNPLKLMGIMSLIVFFFAGIAWGAVPVDPRRFRNRWSDLVISLAGPAANLLLFVVFSVVAAIVVLTSKEREDYHAIMMIFFFGSTMNLALAFFNLLPVPMLDGFAVVRHFVPVFMRSMEKSEFMQIGYVVIIFLLFSLSKYLFIAAAFCSGLMITGITAACRLFS